MFNIFGFLIHMITGQLVKRVWRWDELVTASTLLHQRYRISKVHELGRENSVYLAYDEIQDTDVVVKENVHHDAAHQRQFQFEAALLANLHHPHIPKALDYFIEDGRQFFVMDYIEGINLQQLLQGRKPRTEEVLDWAAQLCDILSYLHSLVPAVIHKDVEPSNIILAKNGQLFLVDFGFAKIYRPEGERLAIAKPSIPRSKSMNHTVVMDRQIARQVVPLITDGRSDQYSLAATLYTLLTGAPPPDSLERLKGKAELASIRSVRSDLSPYTEEVIFRALSLHPNGRFSLIEDFKSALGIKTSTSV